MQITFIIPCYNAEDSIISCLDSINSNKELEAISKILCVDDASTDNTGDVIIEYIETHPNVALYSLEENGGPGVARNQGIRKVNTEYICFVDSDDLINPEVYLKMYHHICLHDEDYVGCNVISFDGQEYFDVALNHMRMMNIPEKITDDLITFYPTLLLGNLCMPYIYRRQIFEDYDLWFIEGYYEDIIFTHNLHSTDLDFGFINERGYIYCASPNSITSKDYTYQNQLTKMMNYKLLIEDLNDEEYIDMMLYQILVFETIILLKNTETYKDFKTLIGWVKPWLTKTILNMLPPLYHGLYQCIAYDDEELYETFKRCLKYGQYLKFNTGMGIEGEE